jgi:hypothetical protein
MDAVVKGMSHGRIDHDQSAIQELCEYAVFPSPAHRGVLPGQITPVRASIHSLERIAIVFAGCRGQWRMFHGFAFRK